MPYTLYKTDGTVLTTIADGNIDVTTTSLKLPGPNYVGYGDDLNENLIYLLENFASGTSPLTSVSLQGQLWFNKNTQTLNVFTANGYQPVSGITVSGTQPLTAKVSDIWYNTVTGQTSIFDGAWNTIGPVYTKAQGISGAIPLTTGDASIVGATHNVVKMQFGSTIMAMFSADPAFAPNPPITGFPTISPGLTFNNTIANPTISANIVGFVTGGVQGLVVGDVVGNLTGNVVATTVLATGGITGNVVATTLSGALTGNTTSLFSTATNFSSGNARITGGRATGLTEATSNFITGNNLSVSNARITSGQITNLTTLSTAQASLTTANATTLVATNFSTSNIQATSGNIRNIVNFTGTTGYFTNLSVANLVIASGSITNNSGNFITLQATNFSSGNSQITGGSVTGLASLSASSASIDSLTVTTSAVVLGGNIVNTPFYNGSIFNAALNNVTATTQATNDRTTKIATTAFVHNVIPTGAIIMWGGLVAAIPAGWQLCDGSNGTPDLRDRFVVGAGSSYAVGATGGNNSVTLTTTQMPTHSHSVNITGTTNAAGAHTHTASSVVADPSHRHIMPGDDQLSFASGVAGWTAQSAGTFAYDATSQGGGGGRLWYTTSSTTGVTVSTTLDSANSHTHSVSASGTSGSAGGATAVDIRPNYYALCYIQKTY